MRTDLPVVEIDGIILREIKGSDYLDYFKIGSKEITCRYLNWGPFKNVIEAKKIIDEVFLKRPIYGLPIGYAITVNNHMIGCIDFHTYDVVHNACEIGYILDSNYWNLGIMTKCLQVIINVGFNHLGLNKIIVGHSKSNIASKKVILKSGFKYEYQNYVKINNNIEEIGYYYSLYRFEWKGNIK